LNLRPASTGISHAMAPSWLPDRRWLQRALIVAVALAAYAPALHGYFLSDDFSISLLLDTEKRSIDWSNTLADFYTVFRGDPTHSYYRPMITLSVAIDYTLWGLNPAGFHLTNLALHIANALLLYGIANALLPSPDGRTALTTALLFVLYPLNPEAIYWIAARSDTLMACFALLSLLLSLHAVASRRARFSALSLLAFLLALATKETAVVLPVAIVLVHAIHATSPLAPGRFDARQEGRRLIPYLLVLGGYFFLRRAITGYFVGRYGASGLDLLQFTAIPLGLVKFLAYQIHPAGGPLTAPGGSALFWPWQARTIGVVAGMAAAMIVLLCVLGRPDRRSWLSLVLTLLFAAPVLTIFSTVSTPYQWARLRYLPSAPFCFLLASLPHRAAPGLRRGLKGTILVTFAALLAVNSLPWILAGRISRTIVQEIERAANRPGIQQIFVAGDPQGYLTAELFGRESWALRLAAAPPFASIPPGVAVIDLASEDGRQLLQAARQGTSPFVILRYDPVSRSLNEVGPNDPVLRRPPDRPAPL